jgi:hypothetical protein
MKSLPLICLTVSILFVQFVQGQAPAIQWQKGPGGSNNDEATCMVQTSDGGYIMAGSTLSTNGYVFTNKGDWDYWVVKYNKAGGYEWLTTYGGSSIDRATSIQQTTDNGYIVAGYSLSKSGDVTNNYNGSFDFWIVKLNSVGAIQWQKNLGGDFNDIPYCIRLTSDGGYIIAGETASNNRDVSGNHGSLDAWIVKLSSTGVIQWQKCLGGSGGENAYFIQQTTDGGYIFTGTTSSNDYDVSGYHGGYDYWVVKLNSTGSIQWQKCFGGSWEDRAYSIEQTKDGGYIVAGKAASIDGDLTNEGIDYREEYWILKLNSSGNIQWQKTFGGNDIDIATCVRQTPDGGYVVAGISYSKNKDLTGHYGTAAYSDAYIIKLDDFGNKIWQKSYGGSNDDMVLSIVPTSDGGYTMAGYTSSNDFDVVRTGFGYYTDFWIVKLTPEKHFTLCPGGGTYIISNLKGAGYQWQQNTGTGFSNLANNANFSGVTTDTLKMVNMSSSSYGFQYRCLVAGNYSDINIISFKNIFGGAAGTLNWSNPANWSCGVLPDANTDVIITRDLTIDVNATCRSIKMAYGAQVRVNPGIQFTVTH